MKQFANRLGLRGLTMAILLISAVSALQAAVPASPSVVTVQGRKVILQRRQADASLSPAITFTINGLNWSPVPVGSNNQADWANYYVSDLNIMSKMNVSVVRTYSPLPMNATGLAVLDYCYSHNIYMIMDVGYDTSNTGVAAVVNFFKNHPAILMFQVGNEWNYNNGYGTFGTSIATDAATVQRMAGVVKANDPNHPVTSSIGNAYDDTPYKNGVFTTCSNVDVWGFNTYLISDASAAANKGATYTSKPYYFSEIGTDAFNNNTQMEDQADQDTYNMAHWTSLVNASLLTMQGGPISGEVFFEFSDEWYKASGSVSTHDNGGFSGPFYDNFANEEWWGWVDVNRNPRQICNDMGNAWRGLNVIPSSTTTGTTPDGGTALTIAASGTTTLQAENYDLGGQGVAYSDTDASNLGSSYRTDGVDIQGTSDAGGGYNVGWTAKGEWLGYTVNVAQAGTYTIGARVASAPGAAFFHLEAGPVGQIGGTGTTNLGTFQVAATGGWQTWTTVNITGVSLAAGTYWIRLVEDTGGLNINYLTFTPGGTSTPSLIGHTIALRSQSNSMYVCAENAGNSALVANRSAYNTWEEYVVVDAGNGLVALQSVANNRYVTAPGSGTGSLIASQTAVGTSEEFTIVNAASGLYALQSKVNGQYVTVTSTNALVASQASFSTPSEYAVVVVK